LETPRLKLRRWKDSDGDAFYQINSDPAVMEFMPKILTRQESDGLMARIGEYFDGHSFGLWALEEKSSGILAGFTGLSIPRFDAHFTPCVEIGWRLGRTFWGRGYATEAALAVLGFGFQELGLPEIVSFTSPLNLRSIAVMERLKMTRNPSDDFDHPALPEGHPLRRHLLYRIARPE
jgi:RimJ/RimL family protein N-acetyltransferase